MDEETSTDGLSDEYDSILATLAARPQVETDSDEDDEPDTDCQLPAPTIPRLENMPPDAELKELCIQLHRRSRILRKLPHARQWPQHWSMAWSAACREFTPVLKTALDSSDDLLMTQTLLDLLELPTRVLSRFVSPRKEKPRPDFQHPDAAGTEATGSRAHRRAESLRQDLWNKAMQELLSNGIAKASPATLKILQQMHPERGEDLKKHKVGSDQVNVSPKTAKRYLFTIAGKDRSSLGCFGWSAPVRGSEEQRALHPVHCTARSS